MMRKEIDLENFNKRSSAKLDDPQEEDQLGYTHYQKTLDEDLNTDDLLLNERKLRKLYNIV